MLETRIPRQKARPPRTNGRLVTRVAATVLGLASIGSLWFLALASADITNASDDLTGGGPLLAMLIGLTAAGFGAGAVALWSRPAPGKLVAWIFVSILAIAAIIFGVNYVLSTG